MFNLQEEVLVIFEAICGYLDDSALIVHAFDNSGSHNQGVSFTCKKNGSYAPIFAYIAQGYM